MTILELEQMGCTVFASDKPMKEQSDIPTYRVRCGYLSKDCQWVYGDFIAGSYNPNKRRYQKDEIRYLAPDLGITLTDGTGRIHNPVGLSTVDQMRKTPYTFANILKTVNADAKMHYHAVRLVTWDGVCITVDENGKRTEEKIGYEEEF